MHHIYKRKLPFKMGLNDSILLFQGGLFVFIVGATFLFLTIWQVWHAYHSAISVTERRSTHLVRITEEYVDDTFLQMSFAMQDVVNFIHWQNGQHPNWDEVRQHIRSQVSRIAPLHDGYIYDQNRQLITSALKETLRPMDQLSQNYFTYHQTHNNDELLIRQIRTSRSSGAMVLPISRRINHPDGSFAGVLVFEVYLHHFTSLLDKLLLDGNSEILLAQEDGTVLLRVPYSHQINGSSLAKDALFTQALPIRKFSTLITSPAYDQVERVYAYSRSPHFPLIIAAGLSKQQALSEWYRQSTLVLTAGLGMFCFLILLGLLLMRQIRRSVRSEQALLRTQDQLTQMNHTLETLAMIDGLTGLANRRQFDLVLLRCLQDSCAQQEMLTLMMLDVDFFKKYNDHYGHTAGDQCLIAVAETLQAIPHRPSDMIARYGGEEFAIILPSMPAQEAVHFAQEIVDAMAEIRLPHAESPMEYVTISIGIHSAVPNDDNPRTFINAADAALYQAKNRGRNGYAINA